MQRIKIEPSDNGNLIMEIIALTNNTESVIRKSYKVMGGTFLCKHDTKKYRDNIVKVFYVIMHCYRITDEVVILSIVFET